MRVVVDALAAHDGDSYVVVLENLLAGWSRLGAGDELHLVTTQHVRLRLPADVTLHVLPVRRPATVHRTLLQSTALPALCRRLQADALLATIPASAMVRTRCPRTATVYDLRHEHRPWQFSTQQRALRAVAYGRGYRLADSVVCASERTRDDLLGSRPWLADRPVSVALLGADHARRWVPPVEVAEPYALAFGQNGNKNAMQVVEGWAVLAARGSRLRLALVGSSAPDRAALSARAAELGADHLVDILPWLPAQEFEGVFAGARVIVFPSDFEGFGLPVPEAMTLGVPVVISTDPALLEVAAGHATVVGDRSGEALADAVEVALARTDEQREQARAHAEGYTWEGTARGTRSALEAAVEARRGALRSSSLRIAASAMRKAKGRYM